MGITMLLCTMLVKLKSADHFKCSSEMLM